jgi:hypothetical protein
MRFVTRVRLLLLVAALLLPTAALAQFVLPIDPDRLDGADFLFFDKNEGENNTLTFDVDGQTFGFEGQVQGNSGSDVVTIRYTTDFPDSASASSRSADVSQDRQVRVTLVVEPGEGSATPAYFGQGAPNKCKAQAKIEDKDGNVDDPDESQASLSCDLRNDFQELDDDAVPGTPGDPPAAVLDAVEQAFDSRKDVKADVSNGRLNIKHKGEAPN